MTPASSLPRKSSIHSWEMVPADLRCDSRLGQWEPTSSDCHRGSIELTMIRRHPHASPNPRCLEFHHLLPFSSGVAYGSRAAHRTENSLVSHHHLEVHASLQNRGNTKMKSHGGRVHL